MPYIAGRYGSSGAILDVLIGVSAPRTKVLQRHGEVVPAPIRVPFLIDTGADTTMVNEDLMRSLGIPRRGSRDVVGSTTHIDPTPCDSYDVSFEIHTPGEIPLAVPALEVLARPFFNVSIYGLIGRDVLDKYQLTMGHGRFRLDY